MSPVIVGNPKQAVEYLWSLRDTLEAQDKVGIEHPDFDVTLFRIDHALFWTYSGRLADEIRVHIDAVQYNDPA